MSSSTTPSPRTQIFTDEDLTDTDTKEFGKSTTIVEHYSGKPTDCTTVKSEESIEAPPEPEPPLPVLEPDHPLLAKFQRSLKEQLEKQIAHLKGEIYEYEGEAKKKNDARERLGVETYETQQIVCKQRDRLSNCMNELKTLSAARQEMETELEERRAAFKEQAERLFEAEKEENILRTEVDSINLLIKQVSEWEGTLESEITISKRIAEKTRKEKLKLAEEKRYQDMILYKLQTEVWKLESKLDTMEMQLKVKGDEREQLAQTVAEGNITIDALQAEHRCLMHSWNSVIVAISNRDKVLSNILADNYKEAETVKSLLTEQEQIKKLSTREMRWNEELSMQKQRVATDVQNTKMKIEDEQAKQVQLEKGYQETMYIIEQIERDIGKVQGENKNLETILRMLNREFDKQNIRKVELEEEILKLLEEQVTNDKASKNFYSLLRNLKERNAEMEIAVAQSENKNALLVTKVESQKYKNTQNQKLLDEVLKQEKELCVEADKFQDEITKCDYMLHKKQREIDVLNTKLLKLIDAQGGVEMSPTLLKIKTLEKSIEDLQEKMGQLQQFWLKEQKNLLSLSQQRQEQINNLNLVHKQILILEQKNLRINDELERLDKQQSTCVRVIKALQNKIVSVSDELARKRGWKQNLDKDNGRSQTEYMFRLKDAELECLQIEAEISQIEEDKIALSNTLVDINREALEWEKKLIMVRETKKNILEAQSSTGEVGNMKAEIHRMEVRYGHLRRAQEKLVLDLEHCLSRREAIVTTSEAREKRTKGGTEKTRVNFQRKLDDMRNKIKQKENEIQEMDHQIRQMSIQKQSIQHSLDELHEELNSVRTITEKMLNQYESTKTDRQLNFELLLQRQKRLNIYTELSKGRRPYTITRSDSDLSVEYRDQKDMNSRLTAIVDCLLGDFPNYKHHLARIMNSLRMPTLVPC